MVQRSLSQRRLAGDGAALTNQAGSLIELQQNGIDITQAATGTNTFTNDRTLARWAAVTISWKCRWSTMGW